MHTNIDDHLQFCEELNRLTGVALDLAIEGSGVNLKYSEQTLMNALYLMNFVLGNIMIHKGYSDNLSQKEMEAKAQYFGEEMRRVIQESCGIDTVELFKKNFTQ